MDSPGVFDVQHRSARCAARQLARPTVPLQVRPTVRPVRGVAVRGVAAIRRAARGLAAVFAAAPWKPLAGAAAGLWAASWAGDAVGCPTCKESMAHDPQAQSMAAGYYYSILFMMSMPFVILGTFGTFAYRSVLKARAAQQASDPATAAAGRATS